MAATNHEVMLLNLLEKLLSEPNTVSKNELLTAEDHFTAPLTPSMDLPFQGQHLKSTFQ